MQTIQAGFEECFKTSFWPLENEVSEEQKEQLRQFFFAGVRWTTYEVIKSGFGGNARTNQMEQELSDYIAEFVAKRGM